MHVNTKPFKMNLNCSKVFCLICLATSPALAFPSPLPDDVFTGFSLDAASKETVAVKRQTFEDNGDRQLKQISLSSLVGDLEKNIFASALSLNKAVTDKNVSIPEIKREDDTEPHVNNIYHLLRKEKINSESTATTATATEIIDSLPVTDKVILQTTEKVPQTKGESTHIVIDRIAIQPHTEGVALIPIFEFKNNARIEDTNKGNKTTKITISKTEITSLSTLNPDPVSTSSKTNLSILNSTTGTNRTTTTEADLNTATTPKNIENLKEAEEELKEKFAEIEADPIILSARV